MKFLNIYICLILCLIIVCCKGTEGEEIREKNLFRTKAIDLFQDGLHYSHADLSYEDEQLTQLIWSDKVNGFWQEEELNSITYSGNRVRCVTSYWCDENWQTANEFEYVMDANKIIEWHIYSYDDKVSKPVYKYLYSYNGENLIACSAYRIMEGLEIEDSKYEVYYDGGNTKLIKYYEKDDFGSWEYTRKEEFDHSHSDLTDINVYVLTEADDWHLIKNIQIFHGSFGVSEIFIYEEMGGLNLWRMTQSIVYMYDVHGTLYKTIEGDGIETIFTYEPGHGNASLFFNLPDLSVYNPPSIKSSYRGSSAF